MAQFHETGYGKRFFDGQLPELINAINRMADATQAQNQILTSNKILTTMNKLQTVENLIGEAKELMEQLENDTCFLKEAKRWWGALTNRHETWEKLANGEEFPTEMSDKLIHSLYLRYQYQKFTTIHNKLSK